MVFLIKFSRVVLWLGAGVCLLHWVLLEFYTRGLITNEVSVIVLPVIGLFLNVLLIAVYCGLGLFGRKLVLGWAFLVCCTWVFQFSLRCGWHCSVLVVVATFPSVIAAWELRRVAGTN